VKTGEEDGRYDGDCNEKVVEDGSEGRRNSPSTDSSCSSSVVSPPELVKNSIALVRLHSLYLLIRENSI